MHRNRQEARRRRWVGSGGGALLALMLLAGPAWAQQRSMAVDSSQVAAPEGDAPVRCATYARMVVPATLGALAGSAVGGVGGAVLGWGEGEFAPFAGALVFGMAGAVAGSATGAWLAGRGAGELSYGSAWIAGGAGILGGLAGSWALREATGGRGWYVGFIVGQGVSTAAVASAVAR